jgi:hypothetical protein
VFAVAKNVLSLSFRAEYDGTPRPAELGLLSVGQLGALLDSVRRRQDLFAEAQYIGAAPAWVRGSKTPVHIVIGVRRLDGNVV